MCPPEMKPENESFRSSRLLDPTMFSQPVVATEQSFLNLGMLAGLLVFATLAFGAVHAWAYSLLELLLLGVGLFFLGWQFIHLKNSTKDYQIDWIRFPLTPWIVCLVLWIAFQLVPLPAGVVAWLSPQAAALRELGTVTAPSWYPLSLNPFATRLELFRLLLAVAMIYLTLAAVKSSRGMVWLILIIAGIGLFEVILGASQLFAQPVRIWGWKTVSGGARLSGTFINPDHMAVFLEMAFFLTFGLFLGLKSKNKKKRQDQPSGWPGFKKLLLEPESMDSGTKRLLIFFLSLVLATGIIFTLSRGGVFSFLVALVTIFFMKHSQEKGKFPWAPLGFFLGSLAVYIWLVAGDIDISRLGTTFDLGKHEGRFSLYGGTLAMAREFPLFGAGWGAFADIFSKYQSEPHLDRFVDMAHSDWLQLLGEIGLIGFLFVFLGAAFYFHYLWKYLQKRQDSFAVGISLGCLGALFSVGFHAAVDFPLHIPANAMLIGVVAALGFLAVHLHRHSWEHFSYPTRHFRCRRSLASIVFGSLAGVIILLAVPVWNHWAAESLVPSEQDFTQIRPTYTVTDIQQAMAYSPDNPAYPVLLAGELQAIPLESEAGTGQEATESETIFDLYRQAIRLNPAQWRYRFEYAWVLIGSGNPENLAGFRQGLQELETCTKLFPASGMVQISYGSALLLTENAVPDLLPPEKKGLWEQEIELGILKEPDLAEQADRFTEKMNNP